MNIPFSISKCNVDTTWYRKCWICWGKSRGVTLLRFYWWNTCQRRFRKSHTSDRHHVCWVNSCFLVLLPCDPRAHERSINVTFHIHSQLIKTLDKCCINGQRNMSKQRDMLTYTLRWNEQTIIINTIHFTETWIFRNINFIWVSIELP